MVSLNISSFENFISARSFFFTSVNNGFESLSKWSNTLYLKPIFLGSDVHKMWASGSSFYLKVFNFTHIITYSVSSISFHFVWGRAFLQSFRFFSFPLSLLTRLFCFELGTMPHIRKENRFYNCFVKQTVFAFIETEFLYVHLTLAEKPVPFFKIHYRFNDKL